MQTKLVMVTVYCDSGKVYCLAEGKVLPNGKVIVKNLSLAKLWIVWELGEVIMCGAGSK